MKGEPATMLLRTLRLVILQQKERHEVEVEGILQRG